MTRLFLACVCIFCTSAGSYAANLVEISPIHRSLLMLRFSDGQIVYHGAGQTGDEDILQVNPLDIDVASSVTAYALTSTDDPAYSQAQSPTEVWRKTKPNGITKLCIGWGPIPELGGDFGCLNEDGDRVNDHYLYLSLPSPMQEGATYTISLDPAIDQETALLTFTFDSRQIRSEAVHANQVAYSTNAPAKYAYIHNWAGDGGGIDFSTFEGSTFGLIDEQSGQTVFTGQLAFRLPDNSPETFQENPDETPNQNFLATPSWECDFSDFNEPGEYRLYVEGIGTSFPFEISCAATQSVYEAVMKAVYRQRSGIALTAEYTDRPRPAPHNPSITPGFADRLIFTSTTICEVSDIDGIPEDRVLWEAGAQGTLKDSWGWYQDAGDWDAYPVHLKVPVELMLAYLFFSEQLSGENLNLPESGNDFPDWLDEARWLLAFYQRLRAETETKGWTSGGVPGARVFGDLWGDDLVDDVGRGSWQDNTRDWYVSGEDPYLSYVYAGMAAHLAYLIEEENLEDPEGIDWQTEAISAWDWAEANWTGDACHDLDINAAKAYAAAALYAITLQAAYEDTFISTYVSFAIGGSLENEQIWGAAVYMSLPEEETDAALRADILPRIQATGDFLLLDNTNLRASRWGGNHFLPMLIGHGTTPLVFDGIMAYALSRDENPDLATEYLASLHHTADYFLGGNPLNMCWVTGAGERSPEQMLILDAWYDGVGTIPDGYIPYGPWRDENVFGNYGWWNHAFANRDLYPAIDQWPGHERWFNTRYAPFNAEFTIHQNLIAGAVLYGVLSGEPNCADGPNSTDRPLVVSLDFSLSPNPGEGLIRIILEQNRHQTISAIRIFTTSGQLLRAYNQLAAPYELDLSSVPSGNYQIEVVTEDGMGVKTYIKQ